MPAYLVRRLLVSIPVLFGITVLAFGALSLAPGDPLTSRIDPEVLARMSPEPISAGSRPRGRAVVTKLPVVDDVAVRLGPTLMLMSIALVVGTLAGIVFGILAAVHQ